MRKGGQTEKYHSTNLGYTEIDSSRFCNDVLIVILKQKSQEYIFLY